MRISWLTLATNRLLAWFAASSSRLRRSSSAVCCGQPPVRCLELQLPLLALGDVEADPEQPLGLAGAVAQQPAAAAYPALVPSGRTMR